MRSAHIFTVASAIVAANATSIDLLPRPPAVAPSVALTGRANASLDNIPNQAVIAPEAVPASALSAESACRDLSLLCEAKAGAEIVVSATSCVCLLNASHDTTTTALNESSSSPAEVTAGGAIPQQVQSSMAGLLGFFIMCLVIL